MPVTQSERIMAIATPLGDDVLLIRSLRGREELGRMFSFELDLISEDHSVKFDDIVGQNVSLRLNLLNGEIRFFNGFVSEFVQVVPKGGFAEYRATVVPYLWFMTRTTDCRIFQNQKAPDIIKEILDKHGYSDIEDTLDVSNYRTREYCVQYRETDFNFISRLMEEEGIYYFFKHEDGKHKLVLCDSLSKHEPYAGFETIDFRPPGDVSVLQEHISDWTIRSVVQPGKFVHTDYNFKKPKTQLLNPAALEQGHSHADHEIFDYPGAFVEKSEGEQYARVRMEELRVQHEMLTGQTDVRGIAPGHTFEMKDHPRDDQNRQYLITSADYVVTSADYESKGGKADEPLYACTFTAIDATVQFRSQRTTPKPIIQGTQAAVVVGPSGEELYPDEFGRVKVQFFWDRYGQMDQDSSCWIRVSQVHAGKSFGGIDIPRIGEEVVVSYEEGDPDRPLIVGRVYNEDQKVPFGLPGAMVVSGMKSNSTKGGGGYNEMSMNDTKGQEVITVHAQFDMNSTVENNQTDIVHNNRSTTVDVDDSETVGNNQSISVGVDQTESIGSNQSISVGSNQSLTVGSKQTVSVGADQAIDVGASRSIATGADLSTSVGGSATMTVSAKETVSIGATQTVVVGASRSTTVGGSDSVKVSANQTVEAGGNVMIKAGATVVIQAGGTLKLECGGSGIVLTPGSIKITSAGPIEVMGAVIKNNG